MHKQTMTRAQFIEQLAETGANHNTIQALFNAYTAGAEHEREQCSAICEELRDEASVADHGRREGLFFAMRKIQSRQTK